MIYMELVWKVVVFCLEQIQPLPEKPSGCISEWDIAYNLSLIRSYSTFIDMGKLISIYFPGLVKIFSQIDFMLPNELKAVF